MNKVLFLLASVLFIGCKTENSNAGTADSTITDTTQQEAKTYENNPELKIDVSKEAFNDFWYGNTEALVIMSREDAPLTIEQITVNNSYVLLSDTTLSGEIPLDNNCTLNSVIGDTTALTNARTIARNYLTRSLVFIDSSISKKKSTCYADEAARKDTASDGEAPAKPQHTELTHYTMSYKYTIHYDRTYTIEIGEHIKFPKYNFYKILEETGSKKYKFTDERPKGTIIKASIFTNQGATGREWTVQ